MAYNTGNALGSDNFRDLSDNAVNFDLYSNGPEPAYPNRFGALKLSITGMNMQFTQAEAGRAAQFADFLEQSGFVYIGDYGAGLTFTTRTQYTVRDGVLYRLAPSTTVPYTTTGNWALEQTKFVAFDTDDVLRQELASSTGTTFVGRGTGTLEDALATIEAEIAALEDSDVVYVTDDHGAPGGGAKGDGSSDDYAAILAAANFAISSGRRHLVFPRPAVSYAIGSMLELALSDNFQIIGIGFPTIKYIGVGAVRAAVSLDYTVGGGRYGIGFSNINVQGNSHTLEALYTRAISHSTFRNVRGWDATHSGITINSGVCNTYDNVRATSVGGLAGAPALAPTEGIVLDQQAVGDYVAWCTFINVIAENVGANGIRINSATGCQFLGGTSEGNPRGIFINVGCNYNLFQNIDFEVNGANSDMVINGSGNVIENCQTLSSGATVNFDVQAAEGTVFMGGNLRCVRLQGPSKATKFIGCRFNDNGSLGLINSGASYTMIGCVKENNAGVISSEMSDVFGRITSTLTYSATTATAANMVIGSDGLMLRSTSALKYKNVLENVTDEMIDAFELIDGMLYSSKIPTDGDRVFSGFVADEFDKVPCLRCFVHYGADGEVEGLMYERLTTLLHAARKRLSRRVDAMEQRLKALEASA